MEYSSITSKKTVMYDIFCTKLYYVGLRNCEYEIQILDVLRFFTYTKTIILNMAYSYAGEIWKIKLKGYNFSLIVENTKDVFEELDVWVIDQVTMSHYYSNPKFEGKFSF